MNPLQTFAAKLLGFAPQENSGRPLSVRAEPANLSSSATAATVTQAIRSAELGNTRELFRLYRDSLLSDEHIQSCLNTRKLAVLGDPLSISARDSNNPDDVAAAAACNRAVEDCENWKSGLAAMMDSCLWPVSVAEKIFRPADAPDGDEPALQYTLRRIEQVDMFLLNWRWAYMGNIQIDPTQFEPRLKLFGIDPNGFVTYDMTQSTYLDPSRHIVHRGHLLTGFKDNWGGPFRSILGWWLLRQLGRDWFGRFMERYGSPFPKAKTDTKDSQKVAFLQEAISLATKFGGFVIDHDDEIELVQAVTQGGAEGYKMWLDVCQNAISRAITGFDAATSPAGLNAGQSDKSENVREDVRMFDQMMLSETLCKQLFVPLLRLNGLPGRVRVSFGGLDDDDANTFAGTLNTLSQAGFTPTDEAIPTVNDRLGFPVMRKALSPANPFAPQDPTQLATFAANYLPPRITHPSDVVARDYAGPLGAAMKDAFAPALKIIQESGSADEAQLKLAAFFADWRPKQMISAIEKPLQICAGKGAAAGTAK